MNLKEIREKYPQYNQISDKDLANKLHQKYYSHVPIEQFYEKIGFNPETKGWSGIGEDILTGIGNTPEKILNYAGKFPSEMGGVIQQFHTNPARFAQNVGGGLVQGLHNTAN